MCATVPKAPAGEERQAEVEPAAQRWTVLLLAGQRPGGDPVAAAFGRSSKALIPVAGEAMLGRVARCLVEVPAIRRIVILAQDTDALRSDPCIGWINSDSRITFQTSQDSISKSVLAATRRDPAIWPVLVTTADHPLLTSSIVQAFMDAAPESDVAVGLVERRGLLAKYPDAHRTWLHFKCGAYTGANLFALRSSAVEPLLHLWADVEQDRKKAWRIAARFGPLLLLRALTRTITLDEAVGEVGRRLGAKAQPVILDQPEAGIDVDKLSDHALAEAIITRLRWTQ